MTGTPKTKPPKNNAEWARNTEKRLTSAENPTSLRAGEWVFSTQPGTGNLIASHISGGSIILAAKPEPSDDADTVASLNFPHIKLERQATQSAAKGSTAIVAWDTLVSQTDGWGFVPTGSDISIPADGVYLCIYHLAFETAGSDAHKATFLVDSAVRMVQEFNPNDAWFNSMYLVDTLRLTAGSLVSCGAFVSGGGTFSVSASTADPAVFTSLSLTRLPVG